MAGLALRHRSLAEYRNHRAAAALQHLYVAALTGFPARFIPEYLSGDRAQTLPTPCLTNYFRRP
jgi:hypothetical protein